MKDIKNYEGLYAITSCGKVWSYRTQKFLKPSDNGYGYLHISLWKDGQTKIFKIHRLVAEAYIPNPNNYEDVDHIDDNRANNSVNNLQWISHQDNCKKIKRHSKGRKAMKVMCVETGEVFDSQTKAALAYNTYAYGISSCIRGKIKTAGGYHWIKVEEEGAE